MNWSRSRADVALDEGGVVAVAAAEGDKSLGEVVSVRGLFAAAADLAWQHPEPAALGTLGCNRGALKRTKAMLLGTMMLLRSSALP